MSKPHPIEIRLTAMRRTATRAALLTNAARGIALVVSAVTALALIDYWMRFRHPALRLLVSLVAAAVLGYAFIRYGIRGRIGRIPKTVLAGIVERKMRRFDDRLCSAVEFLEQPRGESWSGSDELKRQVIHRCDADLTSVDLAALVNWRPAWKAAAAAGLALVAAVLFGTLHPENAATALARLARPLNPIEWPRQYHLVLVDTPARIARGTDFVVHVRDSQGTLPPSARIDYRLADGARTVRQSAAMQRNGGMFMARREAVDSAFDFRVVGGDDDSMDWRHVDVVDPPSVHTIRATVFPPEYARSAVTVTAPPVRALRGSRVQFLAQTALPVKQAWFRQSVLQPIRATIGPQGLQLSWELILETSGECWLELEDSHGLRWTGEERFAMEALPDLPPRITLEYFPATGQAMPDSVIELRIVATDDLAVRDVVVEYTRSDRPLEPPSVVFDDRGPAEAPGGAARKEFIHRWLLSELGAAAGTELTVLARVSDYAGQSGESAVGEVIRLISRDEWEANQSERQAQLAREFAILARRQWDEAEQTRRLKQWMAGTQVRDMDRVDRLRAAALGQRLLGSEARAAADRFEELRSADGGRKIRRPASANGTPREESQTAAREHLQIADQALGRVLRLAEDETRQKTASLSQEEIQADLSRAGAAQESAAEALESVARKLNEAADQRRLVLELNQLHNEQLEIIEQTDSTARSTLAQDLLQLDSRRMSDLITLADRQSSLASRFAQWERAFRRHAADTPSLAGAALSRALDAEGHPPIRSRLYDAGSLARMNWIGRALDSQSEAAAALGRLVEAIGGRRDGPSGEDEAGGSDEEQYPEEQPVPGAESSASTTATGRDADGGSEQSPGSEGATGSAPPDENARSLPVGSAQQAVRSALEGVWGRLPERAREEVGQWADEEFLPKYEAELREFYRRLAEPDGQVR